MLVVYKVRFKLKAERYKTTRRLSHQCNRRRLSEEIVSAFQQHLNPQQFQVDRSTSPEKVWKDIGSGSTAESTEGNTSKADWVTVRELSQLRSKSGRNHPVILYCMRNTIA